jgi:hypothetical protein
MGTELKTSAEKASETSAPPSEPPPPGPFADLPQPLARAIAALREDQLRGQHNLFRAIDDCCRAAYSAAPVDVRLPAYIARTCPAGLVAEMETIYREFQAVMADCEKHDWQAAILEQRRQRDEYQKAPDPTKTLPTVEEVSKSYRLYRDAICYKFGGDYGPRSVELRLQLYEHLIQALEGTVRERLRSEGEDARTHHVKFVPNMGTWALAWLLNNYFALRRLLLEARKAPPIDPYGAAARVSFSGLSPVQDVLEALAVASGAIAPPPDSNPPPCLERNPLAEAQEREKALAGVLAGQWLKPESAPAPPSSHATKPRK